MALARESLTLTVQRKETRDAPEEFAQTGIMVALRIPDEAGERIAVEGGLPKDDLHCTLAYLGSVEDVAADPEDVISAVAEAVAGLPPITGTLGGVGRFTPAGAPGESPGDPVYASLDAPILGTLRAAVVAGCSAAGAPARTDHGFTPHVTLAYIDPEDDLPVQRLSPVDVTIGAVTVSWGAESTDIPLTAAAEPTGAPGTGGAGGAGAGPPGDTTTGRTGQAGTAGAKAARTSPPLTVGTFVSWGSPGGPVRGRIDMVVTSGDVPGTTGDAPVTGTKDAPTARVVEWERNGGGWAPTKTRSAHPLAALKPSPALPRGAAKGIDADATAADHAATDGLPPYAAVSSKAILTVYERGVASWPGPDRTVLDRGEWGGGRVQAFLGLAASGESPDGYVADRDQLHPAHPANGG